MPARGTNNTERAGDGPRRTRDLPRADEKDQTPQRDEPGHGMGDPYLLPPSRRRGCGRGDGPELTTDPPGPVQMTEKSGGCGVSCVVPCERGSRRYQKIK